MTDFGPENHIALNMNGWKRNIVTSDLKLICFATSRQ